MIIGGKYFLGNFLTKDTEEEKDTKGEKILFIQA